MMAIYGKRLCRRCQLVLLTFFRKFDDSMTKEKFRQIVKFPDIRDREDQNWRRLPTAGVVGDEDPSAAAELLTQVGRAWVG